MDRLEVAEEGMTREEAVARIKDHIAIHRYHERNMVKLSEALDMAIKALEQPERKKGKWHVLKGTGLASCECGHITDRYSTYDFCPVCGAKMER